MSNRIEARLAEDLFGHSAFILFEDDWCNVFWKEEASELWEIETENNKAYVCPGAILRCVLVWQFDWGRNEGSDTSFGQNILPDLLRWGIHIWATDNRYSYYGPNRILQIIQEYVRDGKLTVCDDELDDLEELVKQVNGEAVEALIGGKKEVSK